MNHFPPGTHYPANPAPVKSRTSFFTPAGSATLHQIDDADAGLAYSLFGKIMKKICLFISATLVAHGLPYEFANPTPSEVKQHRTIASWSRATFELDRGYVLSVERKHEKVVRIEVKKDGKVYGLPAEFYQIAKSVDFDRARITETDLPMDIQHFGGKKPVFYLSLAFGSDEYSTEGVRFVMFVGSSTLVMIRDLGTPLDLDEPLPRGQGAVTIASTHAVGKADPNQSSQPTPTSLRS